MRFRDNKLREIPSFGIILIALWCLLIALDGLALWGMTKLKYDDGLDSAFKSSTQRYADYADFQNQFDSSANDLVLLFEADDFATPNALETVREFSLEVQFLDGVIGIVSPLAFQVQNAANQSSSLVPTPLLPQVEMVARFDSARADLPELNRFLSRSRKLLTVVLPIENHQGDLQTRQTLLTEIEILANQSVAGRDIKVTLTGYPALRNGIVSALFDDFVLLNVLGSIIGALVSIMALRSVRLAALTAMSAGTALLWVLGLFGAFGITINVVTVALPVLVLVLAYSSALHLTMELRAQHISAQPSPVQRTLKRIAPACTLTAITTTIAFSGLMLSPSSLISNMGFAGVLAVLASLVAVLFAHPLLFATLNRSMGLQKLFAGQRGTPPKQMHLAVLPNLAARHPGKITFGASVLMVIAIVLYVSVEPIYSLYDNVLRDADAFQALQKVEAELAPLSSINIPVRFNADDPASISALAKVQAAISTHAGDYDVISLASLAERARGAGTSTREFLDFLPDGLRGRFVSRDGEWALINILVPNEGAAELRDYVNELTEKIASDPALRDASLAAPTGLLVMSSFLSHDMLLDLNRCFIVAVILSGLLIMIWLRNPVIGLLALLPNVLPVALVGAWLAVSGNGLEFSSGIALTIAFGLVVDDTVHVLNRLRLNMVDGKPMEPEIILRSVRQVAPALVVTSLVLSLGIIGTLFSALPSVTYFGQLSIYAFALALVADLLILPACLIVATDMLPTRVLEINR